MNFNKVYLGRMRNDIDSFGAGKMIYLTKHKWDCGWYWAFGYLGNARTHFHFDSLLSGRPKMPGELFEKPKFTDKQWWIIRDLFIQAYALKKAAEVYRYGGHQTSAEGVTDIIKNADMAAALNADLEKVLDKLWNFICEILNK